MENNKIIVNGIIHCSSMLFICNEGSSFQLDTRPFVEEIMKRQTGKSLKDVYIEQGRKINRIFEYTGENWLGKRRI